MGDVTGEKNVCNINIVNRNGAKDGYNNDLENGSKYNKYRINNNINKNKYHII